MVSQSAGEVVEPTYVTMRWEIVTTWDDPKSPALLAQNAEDTAPTTYVVSCFHRVWLDLCQKTRRLFSFIFSRNG